MRISVKNVSYCVDNTKILDDISLDVEPSKFTLVVGPNGAGKTTLLKILSLIFSPTKGEVLFDDTSSTHLPLYLRRKISLLLQHPVFLNTSVYENLVYPLKIRGENIEPLKVKEIMKRFGLESKENLSVFKLSGGELQRLSLARALIFDPEVILLDEPLNNLDVLSEEIIKNMLSELKLMKKTVVMTSHQLEKVVDFADYICFLENGKVTNFSTREDFTPQTALQARLFGFDNIFCGVINDDGMFESNGVKFNVVSNLRGKVFAAISPEDVIISLDEFKSSARNIFPGVIEEVRLNGRVCVVNVNVGLQFKVLITKESKEALELEAGKKVFLSFKATSVKVFK